MAFKRISSLEINRLIFLSDKRDKMEAIGRALQQIDSMPFSDNETEEDLKRGRRDVSYDFTNDCFCVRDTTGQINGHYKLFL